MRRMTKFAVAAAMGAVLAWPAAIAGAAGTMNIGGTAVLVAKGAGVLVPVEVTCGETSPSPLNSSVIVLVRQRTGNRIVEGSGSAPLVCDGSAHTAEALVTAKEAPFKSGTALVTANAFVCGSFSCESMSDTGEVRFRS